jgi:spore coat protein U-like protein
MNSCRSRVCRSVMVALAAGALWLPGIAQAAASCTLTSTGPAFGNYDPSDANADTANGSVLATCTWTGGGATTLNIVASYSAGNSGAYPNRFMLSGTNRLNYNIYFDSTFATIRGNGTAGTQTGQATITVSSGNRTATATGTLAGRIPAGQNAVPGNYTDTIIITLTY